MLTGNTGTVVGVSIGVVVVIAVFIIDLIVVFVGIWFITKKSIRKNATPRASDKLNAEVCWICLFLLLTHTLSFPPCLPLPQGYQLHVR